MSEVKAPEKSAYLSDDEVFGNSNQAPGADGGGGYLSEDDVMGYNQPAPERGFMGDTVSHLARGTVNLLDTTAHMVDTAMPGGSKAARSVSDYLTEELPKKASILRPDESEVAGDEGMVKKGWSSAVESTPESLAIFPAAMLGAKGGSALGTAVAPGIGTAIGGVVGGIAGGGAAMLGLFGMGQYGQKKEEVTKTLAEKRPDLSPEQIDDIASENALTTAYAEVGGEAAGDLAAWLIFSRLPGGMALYKGGKAILKELANPNFVKSIAKGLLKDAPFEVASEVGTSYFQNEADIKAGIEQQSTGQAMVDAIIPALFLSTGMGVTIGGYSAYQRNQAYNSLNQGNYDQRAQAVSAVASSLAESTDKDVAQKWYDTAMSYVNANEAIPLDVNVSELAARPTSQSDVVEYPKGPLARTAAMAQEIMGAQPAVTGPLTEDARMTEEFIYQQAASQQYRKKRFEAGYKVPMEPDPWREEKRAFQEAYDAQGTVPNVDYFNDEEVGNKAASEFEKKVRQEQKHRQQKEWISSYNQRKADDRATMADENISDETKKSAKQKADATISSDQTYRHLSEAKKRGGLNLSAIKDGYDQQLVGMINRRHHGVLSTKGKVDPELFAREMGYGDIGSMLDKFSGTMNKAEMTAQFTREMHGETLGASGSQTAVNEPQPDLQSTGETQNIGQRRAKPGGEFGANGEWYEGGKFIATTDNPKSHPKVNKPTGNQEIESGVWAKHPQTADNVIATSVYKRLAGIENKNPDGTFSFNDKLSGQFATEDAVKTRKSNIDAYNNGARWGLVSVNNDKSRTALDEYLDADGKVIDPVKKQTTEGPISSGQKQDTEALPRSVMASTPATKTADTVDNFLRDQKGREDFTGSIFEPIRREPDESAADFIKRRKAMVSVRDRALRDHGPGSINTPISRNPGESAADFIARRKAVIAERQAFSKPVYDAGKQGTYQPQDDNTEKKNPWTMTPKEFGLPEREPWHEDFEHLPKDEAEREFEKAKADYLEKEKTYRDSLQSAVDSGESIPDNVIEDEDAYFYLPQSVRDKIDAKKKKSKPKKKNDGVNKEQASLSNAAFSWLQLNDAALGMAKIKDRKGFGDIAESELVAWFASRKKLADSVNDTSVSEAIDRIVVDGKTTFPEKFFNDAYKSALSRVKQDGINEAVKLASRSLEEEISNRWLSGSPADNFTEGWNHAIAGKSRSSLRMNDDIASGYDAARAFLKTPEGKALFSKSQKTKLKDTGAELKRTMDKKRDGIEASESTESIVKKLKAATNRAEFFKEMTTDAATAGAQKLMSLVRGEFYTFFDYINSPNQLLGVTDGEYLGRKASNEDKVKAYLDGRIHRMPPHTGTTTLKDETREERVKAIKGYAEEYTISMFELLSGIKGDTVKDLAVSLTDGIMDHALYKGNRPSLYAVPSWSESTKIKKDLIHLLRDNGFFVRNYIIRVSPETGEVAASGYTTWQLLNRENDDSLKRKSGPPLVAPKLDKITRVGNKDHRKGRNVTPEEFKTTFGFEDVGFGDYVAAQQDQDHLNYAYDAFMDLADILGIPPKAMSIGGRLYFSIGNLGHGKASAHYSSAHPHPTKGSVPVINVTNTRGDGTVSHEWAHALDLTTKNMNQMFQVIRKSLVRSMDWKAVNRLVDQMLKGSSFWKGSNKTSTRQERIDNALKVFDYYQGRRTRTQFFKDALALDGVKNETQNAYWSNEKELLARSFEAWVSDKLEAAGHKSTYLVNPEWVGDGMITPDKGFRGTPYPQGEERKLFNKFYDAMVDSLIYDEKTGEITFNEDVFREKAPNIDAENRAKWDELKKQIPQRAEDIENDEMAKRRDQAARDEETKAMKVGDLVEPREGFKDYNAGVDLSTIDFPTAILWAAKVDHSSRYIKVLDRKGEEVKIYAYNMRIVTPAEDIQKSASKEDIPEGANTNESGALSDEDLEDIFNDALNEVQESTQEDPDAPDPGADIASDLKVGMWTREDIEEIQGLISAGQIILVGDKDLGIPTIHDFPQGSTRHIGFGAFVTENGSYEAHWDGGGLMQKTVGGRAYTRVDMKRGTLPFFNQKIVLGYLKGLLGGAQPNSINTRSVYSKSKAQNDFNDLLAGKTVDDYVVEELKRKASEGGKTWIYVRGGFSRNLPGDGDVWSKEVAAGRVMVELGYTDEEIIAVLDNVGTQEKTTTKPPAEKQKSLSEEQEKTVKRMAKEAAKLGVKGMDEALTGLVKIFGGGKNTLMSFPAGFDEEAYQAAKPHFAASLKNFQEAGRTLKDLFVYLIKELGAGIKPYAIRFAKDEGLTRELGSKGSASREVADFVADSLSKGKPITWQELFSKADQAWGGTQAENKYTSRDAYDAMEIGVNLWLRKQEGFTTNTSAERASSMVNTLTASIGLLPTQTKRTKEQEQYQQFSTPPALAYVANWVAKVGPMDVMMEPSAGTGDMAIWAEKTGASLILNELSSRRAGLLRELFPNASILTEDGLQLNNILPSSVQASVVVMNPPFSATAGRTDRNSTMNGAKHLEQALKRLAPGGRLVAIVGEGMGASKPAFLSWWKDISSKYNVRANISINGSEYAKYGTTFDNQIVVIDNTGKTTTNPITVRVDSVADLPGILEDIRNDRQDAAELTPPQRPGENNTEEGGDTTEQGGDNGDLGTDALGDRGEGSGTDTGMGGTGELPGSVRGPRGGGKGSGRSGSGSSSGTGGTRGGRGGNKSDAGSTEGADTGGGGGETSGGTSMGDGVPPGEVSGLDGVDEVNNKQEGELTDSIFEPYKPQRLSIPGSKEHLGPLVQSAAMASVEPPAPTYVPNIPKEVIEKGLLSLPQLETVVYAGQAHSELLPDGKRRGYFIGDNTGVGKGREISGVIMDNIRQGRKKAVWVSKSADLINDARRDYSGIGGDSKIIFAKPNSPDAPIKQKDGILFITYDSLKTPEKQKGGAKTRSRLDQVLEWLGDDFDGVIAFDESHAMGNAIAVKGVRGASKPSQNALTGVALQNQAANSRILYVSATGATEVKNLSYATRLGLWGENTPFANVSSFINNIVTGGVAAMEMVARDMKALGSYIARSLSYDGIEYRTLKANLSSLNRAKYDELAKMWQVVLKDVNKALDDTGGRAAPGAKKNALAAFWGGQQRFFNQVLTAMQTPAMIEDAKKQLEDGKSVVVQLTNHYAGQADREVAKAKKEGKDLEELDLTPRQMLEQFLINSFPTQQYEEQTDDAGNTVMVPVLDSNGKPVHNADAIAARDKLLETLRQISIPNNPIDTIIEQLGKENVAEITGRSRRYLSERDGKGGIKVVEEKRGKSASSKEAKEFQNGDRRVLIFSGAGATGFSFHADNTKKNKQQRIHYVLQPGWRADTAVQGFGRTHRTNQASSPEYVLVTTDVQAQKRFVSSIARRLDQLGALTKGQRETSGGLFNASDNLESKYGTAALNALFTNMFNGYTEMDFNEVTEEMGISNLVDKEGKFLPRNIPEMTKFLNRLLSLTIDRQDQVFDTFFSYLDEIVNNAIEKGTYDTGLRTIKAASIKKVRDDVVFTDERTKATTRFVEVDISNPVKFREFDDAKKWAKSRGSSFKGWYAGPRTKIFGLVDLGERLDENNVAFRRGEVVGIVDGSKRYVDNAMNMIGERGGYKKIQDEQEAQNLWEQAIKDAPKTSTERKHMLVGVLMPIWDRIVGNPTIFRMQTDSGEVLLGRTLSGKELTKTMKNLGVNGAYASMSPKDFLDAIRSGSTVILANGMEIKAAGVSGQRRIEVTAGGFSSFSDAEIGILKNKGAFHEVISWKDRVFIPTNDKAESVLKSITEANPVVDIEGGTNEAQSRGARLSVGNGVEGVPDGDRADILAELTDALGRFRAGRLLKNTVKLIESQEEARALIGSGSGIKYSQNGAIQGFVLNGEVHLVKDGIKKGDAYGVLLHELGEHAAQLGFSSDQDYQRILNSLESNSTKSGATGDAIRAAMADVPADTTPGNYWSEVAGYLVEKNTKVSIVDRILSFFKKWMVKAGVIGADRLSHKDIVAFAQAAVRAEGDGIVKDAMLSMANLFKPVNTDSPSFKRWIGNSQVTEPVYHGSKQEFYTFDRNRIGQNTTSPGTGLGFFFATDRNESVGYAGPGRAPKAFFVKMENPKRMNGSDLPNFREPAEATAYARRQQLAGHDGIILEDEGHVIAFEANQVKSAEMNTGDFDGSNPDVRYSIAGSRADIKKNGVNVNNETRFSSGIIREAGNDEPFITSAREWFKSSTSAAARKMHGLLTLRQIVDIFGKEIPQVKDFYEPTRLMDSMSNKLMKDADEVYQEWAGLNRAESDEMSDIMAESTIAAVDPETGFVSHLDIKKAYQRIEKLKRDMEGIRRREFEQGDLTEKQQNYLKMIPAFIAGRERAIKHEQKRINDHSRLSARFNKLSPDAKKVWKAVRGKYDEHLKILFESLEDRVNRTTLGQGDKKAMIDKIRMRYDRYIKDGPYFPLSRFGDYIAIATRDEEREVHTFDTKVAHDNFVRRRRASGWSVQTKTRKEYSPETDGVSGKVMTGILRAISDSKLKASERNQLLDEVNQIFIKALPDLSHRKHFHHRKKTAGFSRNQMRAFAANMQHSSHHIARINFADSMAAALESLEKETHQLEGNEDATDKVDVLNELIKRHKRIMNPNISPVAQAITSSGFIWNIGPSIASALVNLSQTPLVAFPLIATKFKSGRKTFSTMGQATKDFFSSPWSMASGFNLQNNKAITTAERGMIEALVNDGTIDTTQMHSLAQAAGADHLNMLSSRHGHVAQKVLRITSYPFHVAEVANRQITALTAYRMAIGQGKTHGEAIDLARELTLDSHFDYSQANRARFMEGNFQRVLFLFKQYSQQMTYLLGRSAYQAMRGESKEVKAEAAKRLLGIIGGHFVFSGVLGMPAVDGTMWLIETLINALGDDDDPFDWETSFRNTLTDAFGKDVGEAIAKGPARLMPLLGDWDFSSRMSLGDLWFRQPDREMEGRDEFNAYLNMVLGPVATNAMNIKLGIDAIAGGEFERGVEAMLPKALKDVMKFIRYSRDGVRNFQDDQLIDNMKMMELAGQLIGFSPSSVNEMYSGVNAIKNHKTAIGTRRKRLVNSWVRSMNEGDYSKAERIFQDEIMPFNAKNPVFMINRSTLLKSAQNRSKIRARTTDGIYLPSSQNSLRNIGRFSNL